MENSDFVTVYVTTSPVRIHPSVDDIANTLASIRSHLPGAVIHVLSDGPRPEHGTELTARYQRYRENLERLLKDSYEPFYLHRFKDFQHQVRMMRFGLLMLRTPLVLFMEHDTPLVVDENRPIPWGKIFQTIYRREVDFIRFLPEPQIHSEHRYLMRGMIYPNELPLMATVQFSARPHVASSDWYHRALGTFTSSAQCFIEDGLYTHCVNADWAKWKMAIYNPPGNAQFSLHTDARSGAPKLDELQVF